MLQTTGHCPNHADSRWAVEEAFDNGSTLAIITDRDGMSVWELGLTPGDEGFREMQVLARQLVAEHNEILGAAGSQGLNEGESVPKGFASDLSASPWSYGCTVLAGTPVGAVFAAAPEGELIAAILGPGLCPAEGIGLAAKQMIALHNGLLPGDGTSA